MINQDKSKQIKTHREILRFYDVQANQIMNNHKIVYDDWMLHFQRKTHCVIFVTSAASRIKTNTNHNDVLHPRRDNLPKTVVLPVSTSKRRAQCTQQHKLENCQQWNTYSHDMTYEGG